MKKVAPSTVLLGVALIACGCQTVPPPQHAETASSHAETDRGQNHAANEDEYNRTYQSESQRRHHHDRDGQGNRDRASNDDRGGDNWGYGRGSDDRAETDERSSGNAGAYQPRQGDSRSMSGGGGAMTGANRHHNSHALTAAPGQFDFYVLNLSWSPEFCHGHPAAAECAQHRAFTLHGLWPQNNDGTYPEDCSDEPGPASPAQYADIYPDAGLLEHEWQTHGSCSGLTADQFFARARQAEQSIHIPAELSHLTQQTTLTPTEIDTLFLQNNPGIPAGALAISCGNNYLTAVEVCVDKNLKPENCSGVKTCGANQVRIPAPQ